MASEDAAGRAAKALAGARRRKAQRQAYIAFKRKQGRTHFGREEITGAGLNAEEHRRRYPY